MMASLGKVLVVVLIVYSSMLAYGQSKKSLRQSLSDVPALTLNVNVTMDKTVRI